MVSWSNIMKRFKIKMKVFGITKHTMRHLYTMSQRLFYNINYYLKYYLS